LGLSGLWRGQANY